MSYVVGHRKVTTIEFEERNQWLGRPEVRYVTLVMCIGCWCLLPVAGNAKSATFGHKVGCAYERTP